ncbi:uncharacterized protein CLUP02_03526 [Colletotrichum lupini]|uniref:Uncharacterized protein n=1 Tax=Colletotrichum lupini TaxID=145971 RepID=A0A9Q8WCU0_9PEZI|nr:uncharacterized protein CLUP02_03526 [Colletotrichum lupini]UQC78052.1 hypothetical protein CLUP02_03526 [Colletotrichum lupini]
MGRRTRVPLQLDHRVRKQRSVKDRSYDSINPSLPSTSSQLRGRSYTTLPVTESRRIRKLHGCILRQTY